MSGVRATRDTARVSADGSRPPLKSKLTDLVIVSGMSGEQYALPDAVDRLREVRRSGPDDHLIAMSGADPLNLTGIITLGDRIRASAGTRIVYRNGIPVMAMEGDMLRSLADVDATVLAEAAAIAAGRRVPVSHGYVGRIWP